MPNRHDFAFWLGKPKILAVRLVVCNNISVQIYLHLCVYMCIWYIYDYKIHYIKVLFISEVFIFPHKFFLVENRNQTEYYFQLEDSRQNFLLYTEWKIILINDSSSKNNENKIKTPVCFILLHKICFHSKSKKYWISFIRQLLFYFSLCAFSILM